MKIFHQNCCFCCLQWHSYFSLVLIISCHYCCMYNLSSSHWVQAVVFKYVVSSKRNSEAPTDKQVMVRLAKWDISSIRANCHQQPLGSMKVLRITTTVDWSIWMCLDPWIHCNTKGAHNINSILRCLGKGSEGHIMDLTGIMGLGVKHVD